MASLSSVQNSSFRVLAESLDLNDQELSRQLSLLEKEGLVDIMKARRGRKSVTQVRISEEGLSRFKEYQESLRSVAFPESGQAL